MTDLSTDRRNLMRTVAIGGVGLTAGAVLGGGAVAIATGDETSAATRSLVVEVACLGHTIREMAPPLFWPLVDELGELDEGDLRGGSWYVEGMMYPEGTILGDGFIPTDVDRIGTWFCRGNGMSHSERQDPHLVTQQEYYFGSLADDPIGSRMLLSTGVEGRDTDGWRAHRAVVGGTGLYRGARGEVIQEEIGINSTEAPNFRFEFDFDVL